MSHSSTPDACGERPLHSDASASREPTTQSLHSITALSNAALPSRKFEGFVGPHRPWSSRRSCGAPPRDLDSFHLRAPHTRTLYTDTQHTR